jgi:hypothetical protein
LDELTLEDREGAKVPSQVDALCFYCASQGTPYRLANRRHPYFLNQLIAASCCLMLQALSGREGVGYHSRDVESFYGIDSFTISIHVQQA